MKDHPLRQPCPNLQNILFTTPPTLRKENDVHVWCVLRKDLKCMSQFFLFSTFTLLLPTENTFSPHWYQKVRGRPLWTAILSSCSYTWMCKSSYISDKCSQIHVPICKIHVLQSIFFSNKVDILTLSRLREEKGSLFNISPIQS